MTFSMTFKLWQRKLWKVPYLCVECAFKHASLNPYCSSASDNNLSPTYVIVKKSTVGNINEQPKRTTNQTSQPQAQFNEVNPAASTQTVSEAPYPGIRVTESPDISDAKLSSASELGTVSHFDKPLPEAPTTCCQSGCPNCVWLDYAEQLSLHYKDGGQGAINAINRDIQDPNLREYLLFEIRMKFK